MELYQFLQLCSPLLRVVVGWYSTAGADGKLEKFEFVKLGQSLLQAAALTFLGAGFFSGLGIDVDVFTAAIGATLVQMAYDIAAKLKAKKAKK